MYGLQGATNPDAVDQQKATAFVDALTQFDRRMNQVVVDSNILKGIPQGRLKAAGNALCSSPLPSVLHSWLVVG